MIFDVPVQKGFYIDMRTLKLHIQNHLLQKNGCVLAGSDRTTTQSAILYSMFRDLQVNFNNRTMFWGKFLYGYYANFLLLFKIPSNEKTVLYSSIYKYNDHKDLDQMWESKEVTQKDGTMKTEMVHTGYDGEDIVSEWNERTAMHLRGEYHEVMGNILFDLAFQSRLLRDDINLKFTFTQQNPEFCLLSSKLNAEYMLEISKAILQVPRISVRPSALPRIDLDYYFIEHRMMSVLVPENTSNFNHTLISGPLPHRVIMCQVDE
ncbi:hypothetical protein [Oceanimonas doudoroffii]|uniref:Uncharacterized protein n=1 Tax=Oceanimonas doudoroffii TaxID=84158 RepID=A0A233RAA8_9GAMM|nr:hypothetical protein [Oceanimonas doudoroffii]OXY80324.1 hypothetical protein B6S08_18085 [Oceanimonas doudoroffii]